MRDRRALLRASFSHLPAHDNSARTLAQGPTDDESLLLLHSLSRRAETWLIRHGRPKRSIPCQTPI